MSTRAALPGVFRNPPQGSALVRWCDVVREKAEPEVVTMQRLLDAASADTEKRIVALGMPSDGPRPPWLLHLLASETHLAKFAILALMKRSARPTARSYPLGAHLAYAHFLACRKFANRAQDPRSDANVCAEAAKALGPGISQNDVEKLVRWSQARHAKAGREERDLVEVALTTADHLSIEVYWRWANLPVSPNDSAST
ncbi:hypothetical protein [Reyranella sp.]|uniref:hypothetical protein n=1 Tax=Reyranella sp. TaxID=1929291 RepID=UPI003C7A49E9